MLMADEEKVRPASAHLLFKILQKLALEIDFLEN